MSARLPVEIIQQILECIEDKPSLENLFRVARPLTQQLIATILYTEIVVLFTEGIDEAALTSPGLFEGLHIHQIFIHDYPWLPPYVEQLTLLISHGPSVDGDTAAFIKEVLPVLVNLKRFRLAKRNDDPVNQIDGVAHTSLEGGFQSSLTHFIWDTHLSSDHIDTLTVFLASQPNLEHLVIDTDLPAVNLPAVSLQRLRLLRSYPTFALSILPGRRVSDLALVQFLEEKYLETDDPQLDEAFRRIQTLQAHSVGKEVWMQLVQRFVNLEFLKVEQAPLSIILMNSLLVAAKPTKLRYVRIALSWNSFEQEQLLVSLTFDRLPSLQVIDYEVVWDDDRNFTRVYREAQEPCLVDTPRDVWMPWWHGCQLDAPGNDY